MNDFEIFANAPEGATPEELREYLDEACGGDRELRERVESLIAADGAAGDFLPAGAIAGAEDGKRGRDREGVGAVIGGYKLLQEIGEGGFGVVYMAEQFEPVKRRVALKVIKQGMDTRQVVARFEAERQALAMMDHASIAKVFDGGATESGRPYFVMELVRGVPITEFCDDHQLTTTARLELFMEVCAAVQHAHQKGVIHRDLKPSNVLVTMHDDKPVPKVIDFGVAKATQQDLTDKTLFTRFEQFIGTPAYMSPEQTQLSGLDTDTRSDIYALGVLLYELMTGTTPFDAKSLASAGHDEIRRVIREEEPPKPSTRLGRFTREELTERAKRHHVEPERLGGELRGDLDWIVMKALEKDRTRRYGTATGLAEDLRRHLANEPVAAAAPGALYRVGKFVKRNRGALAVAGSIAAVLVVSSFVSVRMAVEANEAKDAMEISEEGLRLQLLETEAERRRAREEERAAELRFVEEQLAAGKTDLGIAKLAQLLRGNLDDRGAAERLMSEMRQRELRELLLVPGGGVPGDGGVARRGDLDASGDLLVTIDDFGAQVWDTSDGTKLGGLMRGADGAEVEDAWFAEGGEKVVVVAEQLGSGGTTVQVWDWRRGVSERPLRLPGRWWSIEGSRDGRLLFAGDKRGGWIFDLESGEAIVETALDFTGGLVEFSADGKWLAVPDGDRSRRQVWDVSVRPPVKTGARLVHDEKIWSVEFSGDGERVLTGSADGTARVWEVRTGLPVGEPMLHGGRVHEASFSADGRLVATGSWDGTVGLWDAETGGAIGRPLRVGLDVWQVEFSTDGSWLAVSARDGNTHLWNVVTGRKQAGDLGGHWQLNGSEFSTDSGRLLTWDAMASPRLWRVKPGQPICQMFRHAENPRYEAAGRLVWKARFHPLHGGELVTTASDGRVKFWNAGTGKSEGEEEHWGWLWETAYSGDGKRVLTCSASLQGLRVWSRDAGGEPVVLIGYGEVRYAEFSPVKNDDGDYLVVGAKRGGEAQVWNATSGEPVGPPLPMSGRGASRFHLFVGMLTRFSPDAQHVAVGADDGTVRVFRTGTDEMVAELSGVHGAYLEAVCFSPDGTKIVTTSADHTAVLWDWRAGEVLRTFRHRGYVGYTEFDLTGERLLTASHDGTARVWDVETGEAVGLPLLHSGNVRVATFSPDGTRVLTASGDGTARVWDAETGYPLSGVLAHDGAVLGAEFSPDGRRAATVGSDLTARVWEVPPAPAGAVPAWVPAWAEAVVGLRVDDENNASVVPLEERRAMRERVRALAGDDYYAPTAKWVYEPVQARPISPFSSVSFDDYVENRIRENTVESLEEALRVDPRNPFALGKLALLLRRGAGGEAPEVVRRAEFLGARAIEGLRELLEEEEGSVRAYPVLLELELTRENLDLAFSGLAGAMGSSVSPGAREEVLGGLRTVVNAAAEIGCWDVAREVLELLIEFDESDAGRLVGYWARLVAVSIALDDRERFRKTADEIVSQFSGSTSAVVLERSAKALLVVPWGAGSELEREAVGMARRSLAMDGGLWDWKALCAGMAEYRAGDFGAAVERMDEAAESQAAHCRAPAQGFRAMALWRLGRQAEAAECVKDARAEVERQRGRVREGLDPGWHNWVFIEAILSEAERMGQ